MDLYYFLATEARFISYFLSRRRRANHHPFAGGRSDYTATRLILISDDGAAARRHV